MPLVRYAAAFPVYGHPLLSPPFRFLLPSFILYKALLPNILLIFWIHKLFAIMHWHDLRTLRLAFGAKIVKNVIMYILFLLYFLYSLVYHIRLNEINKEENTYSVCSFTLSQRSAHLVILNICILLSKQQKRQSFCFRLTTNTDNMLMEAPVS